MFVFNLSFSKNKLFKVALILMSIVCIILIFCSLYKVIKVITDKSEINDDIPKGEVAILTNDNYTNILEEVHNNIDTYIGQKISYSGYIYRVVGFDDNQFVLARDMDIGNNQTLIVGFLCQCDDADQFPTDTWVELSGEITKGNYNSCPIPIIKVNKIQKIDKPADCLVNPPDSNYVPTANIY